MKTKKMTKAEKLAAYKAEKAAAKLLKEQHSLLADYLAFHAEVIIANWQNKYCHDCMIMAKEYKNTETMEQQIRLLYGDSNLFGCSPGRFSFPVENFFDFAKNENPHLLFVVPRVLRVLYKEGLIDFVLSGKKDIGIQTQATFNIIRL